ncbi:MAG: DUF2889 domain-containing protein [Acidimicrobiia bacterium]
MIDITPMDDPWHLDFADLDSEPMHYRNYAVRAFRLSPSQFLLRGVVDDRKAGKNWVPWDDRPMVIHHMVLDMVVSYPGLVIESAKAVVDQHPQPHCPSIEPHYQGLVGLSIARGFTHKVRELFGGPKGCTHVTALVQAMAPVAMQATWGMDQMNRRDAFAAEGHDVEREMLPPRSTEDRVHSSMRSINTCHVFAEDGLYVSRLRQGIANPVPLTVQRRLAEHGLAPETFNE